MQPETNLFKICPVNEASSSEFEKFLGVGNKVAPGLEIAFLIRFSPETKNDYKHELVIVTEREKFIVPIHAIGKKALLDFPDSINFGTECPVKYNSEKSVILHNRGDKATKWDLKLPEFFSASKTEGLIEENSTEQILIRFFPLQNKAYEEVGKLLYDGDEASFILKGNAINGEVYLSKDHMKIDETYISLESKQTFKIVNKSTVKIEFEWRAFSSEKEETEKKKTLNETLNLEESEKKKIINEMIDLEENIDDLNDFKSVKDENEEDNSFDDGSSSEREIFLKKRKKAEMLLERKYKTIRKALEEDTFVFEDEIFSIQPIRGSIWPNSEMVITVIFKPKSALKYTHKAFCNVSCSDERLPLYLEGEGLGPKAFLSTNILSIGDIFVNDKQSFNLYIENKGEIPAHFSLMKNNSNSTNIITFDSEEGVLAVGQRMNIILTFQSFRVGEFQEMFKWRLEGSSELLTLLVRGHVRSPRFEFDKKSIDFKKVSYQFEDCQELLLTNTSSVMFTFSLRIPQDGKGSNREFEIIPSTDSITPGEAKRIQIKFIPHYRKFYNMVLVLDMEGIGKDMKTIPITAESDVPRVRLGTDTLDFGDIFLRYPQTKHIELINESKLYARFVIHPVNPKFAAFGKVTTDLDKGQIAPESSVSLNVGLTTCCLKNFQIDLILEIISDTNEQHLIKIKGNSIGPIVELSQKEIDFGERDVLQKHVKKITITNKSIIEADFYAFTKTKNSIFMPVQRHYVLNAGQSFDIDILCIPDDNQKFVDTLFFVIKEGVDKEVKLKAKGIGSTIFCKDISIIDFGVLYTHRTQMQEVFIENKGRKTQTLKWTRKIEGKPKQEEKVVPSPNNNIQSQEDNIVFSVFPETMVLPAKTGLMFQFKAHSIEVGKIKEQFILSSSINSERKSTNLFTSSLEAEFIRPQLSFNKKSLNFQYVWEKNADASIISQDLEIICSSQLATNFALLIEPPFNVSPENVSLLPGKKAIVRVDFDPTLKKDKISGQIFDKLWIRHNKHPKNESFPVSAEFCYPNLAMSTDEINFGAVMNDTIKKYALVIKNTSLMSLNYCWFFADQVENELFDVPLNEVFDILPLRGTIEPQSEENVEFLYFAVSNKKFNVTAICKVEGGPDYCINVTAEASNVAYTLSLPKKNKTIDIGETFLGTKVMQEFEIENTSKVMFDYSIHIDFSYPKAKSMCDFISFSPAKGLLSGGDKIKIKLYISPGFPGEFSQSLILQIAHFEPERIYLKGYGLFPSLRLDVKRKIDSDLIKIFQKLKIMDHSNRNFESIFQNPSDEQQELLNQSLPVQNDQKKENFSNVYEATLHDIKNESIVEIERVIIKNFIKQNRTRITVEEKKSFGSNNDRSQKKLGSSAQTVGKDDLPNKVKLYKNELKLFEEIILGSYLMNLGTIIAGNKATRNLKVSNIGKCIVNFGVDMKGYKSLGLSISNTKIHKLPFNGPVSSINLQICLQTKKTTKPGKQTFHVAINVENGGKYILEIVAFVTVPELSISSERVDFGVVQIGMSKKIFIRLDNTKEINCDWSAVSIAQIPRITNKKEEVYISKISIMPNHGTIVAGGKKMVELCFDPNENRIYEETISFNFKDSTRKMDIICIGEAILPHLEFIPNILTFPPCMPKMTTFRSFLVKNNSEFEICLVATDKDQEILEEEKMLTELPFSSIRTKVRNMDEPFWPELKDEIDLVRFKKNIEIEVAEIETTKPENWSQKVNELQTLLRDKLKKKNQLIKIPFSQQDNIIIISHFKDLAKIVAEFLQENQMKAVINLQTLLEWNLSKKTQAGLNANNFLENAKIEQDLKEAERKKNKNKKPTENDQIVQITLPSDLFEKLLTERLSDCDCNVGCIFYSFKNDLVDERTAVSSIIKILSASKIVKLELSPIENSPHQQEVDTISNDLMNESSLSTPKKDDKNSEQNIISYMLEKANELKFSEEQKAIILASLEENNPFLIESSNSIFEIERGLSEIESPPNHIKIEYKENLTLLNYNALYQLPKPNFPDPNQQAIPEPQELQIIKKTLNCRKARNFKNFKVLTPIEEFENEMAQEEINLQNYTKFLTENVTRWILKPKSSRQFFVLFSSEFLGDFSETFTFENFLTIFNNYQKPFNFVVKASTEYPSISKTIANIFPNRRKNRSKVNSVMNEYIISENLFEFGPLLIISKSQMTKSYIQKRNSTVFRFSNASNYPVSMNLMLQSEIGDFTACPSLQTTPGIFEIEQKEVTIGAEPCEVRVWGFPKVLGVFVDSLICVIKNNPIPYKIKMACTGILPSVNISTNEIIFDRILVDKKSISSFEIKNDSLIPIRWKIINFAELQKNGFEVSKETSDLEVDEKISLDISFMTKSQEKKNCQIQIDVEDCQNLGIKMKDRKIINLIAEGFKVNVSFTGFKATDKMLIDFGNTLVDFPVENTIGIKNEGIYPIKYQVDVVKPQNLQYFEISPSLGELLPNTLINVQIRFTAKKEIVFEEKLKDSIINIKIFERNDVFNQIPIFIKANSQYAKCSIEPCKNLSFGPVAFYETKVKTFEVTNNGQFEFCYELYEYDNQTSQSEIKKKFEAMKAEQFSARVKAKNGLIPIPKAQKGKVDKLILPQFTIFPVTGNLLPGQTQKFEVSFKGQGSTFYESKIGFEHTNRNPQDQSNINYLLSAESCVPCLETQNFRVIFEEQVVTQSLVSTGINIQSVVNSNIFSIEDNAFYFGNIVPTQNPDGITERIKIINNGKVFANVKFDVLKKNSSLFAYDVYPKQAKINPHESVFVKISFKPEIMAQYEGIFSAIVENGDATFPNCKLVFDLKGEGTLPSLNIIPEGLTSLPSGAEMCLDLGKVRLGKTKKSFVCVKNIGIIPATFQCFLSQQNPSIKLVSPPERTLMPLEVYQFQFDFMPLNTGKMENKIVFSTLMNPYERNTILLKGECVDEVCVFEDFEGEDNVIDFGDIIALPAKKLENHSIHLIEKVQKYGKKKFIIRNFSNETLRVEIFRPDDTPFIDVKPNKVHIPPKMNKKIAVTLNNPSASNVTNLNKDMLIRCNLISLKNKSSLIQKLANWDSSKTTKRLISQIESNWIAQVDDMKAKYLEEKLKNPKVKEPIYPTCPVINNGTPLVIERKEPILEPEFDIIPNFSLENKIKILARIDVPKIILETNQIVFKATKMYGSRVFTFKVTNSSSINIPFECDFFNPRTSSKDPGPFSVSPSQGLFQKNSSLEFLMRFAPVEFESNCQRILLIKIGNGETEEFEFKISLEGEVHRPICHFELPYTISDLGEKLIEIETLGINTKVSKKFHVINPTLLGYEFVWCGNTSKSIGFKCITPKGIILPGKKFEMVFEFSPETNTPERQDIQLTFNVAQFNLNEKFVFRTKILQPKLFFSTSKIDFGPLLLSGKSKEIVYIKNLDQSNYSFYFSKTSLKGTGNDHHSSLKISPLSGQLAPGQDTPITLTFSPKMEIDFNYNLQVVVPQKKEPLTLNVKGRGYKLHHEMRLNSCLIDTKQKHLIDFGEMFVHEYRKKVIEVFNSGDFNIDFLLSKKPHHSITIQPENGTVRKGEQLQIELVFQSMQNINLNTELQIQIVSGPVYDFIVQGVCKSPMIEISPRSINFGEMILKKSGVSKTMYIECCNLDKKTLTIESDFTKNEFLELKMPFGLTVLPFEDKKENIVKLPITFKPVIEGKFATSLNFFVNGRHKIEVAVKGEAINCLFELANPPDILTDFGIVHVNSKQNRSIAIKNFSKLALTIKFDIDDQLAKLASLGVTLNPTTINLQKKAIASIEVFYAPQQRQRQFYIPVRCFIQDSNEIQELFTLSGACFGPELKLIEENLSFGHVVVNSYLTKKVQLINSGDLSADFTWELGQNSNFLSISPNKGVIAPNEQTFFEVTFSPKSLSEYKTTIKLFIKGREIPFSLSIGGRGISTPASSIETVNFETNARTKIVKMIVIKNPSPAIWNLRPTITSDIFEIKDYFTCAKTFDVPALGQYSLNITYNPLSILPEKQNCLLFVPLSDGSALTYQLQGKVLPPKPEEPISLNFKAKTPFIHSILITNWLAINQKFNITYELPSGKAPSTEGILINSVNIIEVAPDNAQNFKMSINALKKGNFVLNVFLRNKENKEYIHYILNLNVEESMIIKSFELFNFVRESKTQAIPVENPLQVPVTIPIENIVIDSKDIFLNQKTALIIKPQSETYFEVIYRPLLICKNQKTLVKINSPELGNCVYELILNSERSSNIPTINFKASLGNDHTRNYLFSNFLQKQAQYNCKIERLSDNDVVNTGPTDYTCESANITAQPAKSMNGTELTVNIKFEPSSIGISKALLTISNPEGGEYQAYLIGSSSSPLPKGPFKITTKGTNIDFKNTFYESKEFFIKIDNPNFTCSTKSPFKLEAKKSLALPLVFKNGSDNSTGRIIIETKEMISWIYYLQGI